MIGSASAFDLSLWLVPAAFYIFDNISLLGDYEFLVAETATGKCTYRFANIRFQVLGKTLYIGPILGQTARREYLPFRGVAVIAASYLFVLGPLLTIVAGLLQALIFVFTFHIGVLLGSFVLWYPNLRKIGATKPALAALFFEFLICPGYLPNICRRLSLRYVHLPVDGVLFLKGCADRDVFVSLSTAVASRLEELELADADDPESGERYAHYRMELTK